MPIGGWTFKNCSEEEKQMKVLKVSLCEFALCCPSLEEKRWNGLRDIFMFEIRYSEAPSWSIFFSTRSVPRADRCKKTRFGITRPRMWESQLLRDAEARWLTKMCNRYITLTLLERWCGYRVWLFHDAESPIRDGGRKRMDDAKMLRWCAFSFIQIATGCRP